MTVPPEPPTTPPHGYGYPPPYAPQIPAPPAPAPHTRPAWLIPAAAGLLAGAILGSGITYLATAPEETPKAKEPGVFTLTGTMTARGEKSSIGKVSSRENGCAGTGGYQDMRSGTTVTVYDTQGTVLGQGTLGPGTYTGDWKSTDSNTCTFPVTVTGVPEGKVSYQVEVGRRGKLLLTEEEAKNGGFAGSLS
ncbi:hypothetical protein ACODT5_28845 [Streptomyces sp. 5.8]|uniref:hypothetical protein n=1 Tax=Streptomyces sp. 5.8 TaxID=3406571 RepID=UPI003BB66FBF